MIILDAINKNMIIKWDRSLRPQHEAEFNRLQADGHQIEHMGRHNEIKVTPDFARRTQLYRTLPHEIGHWFDWLSKVKEPDQRGEDYCQLVDRYFSRPSAEREAFAHRYADDTRSRLAQLGLIPFQQLPDDGWPPSSAVGGR